MSTPPPPLNPEAEEYRYQPRLNSAPAPLPVALPYFILLHQHFFYLSIPIHTQYPHCPHPIPTATTVPAPLYPEATAAAAPQESTEAPSPHSSLTVKSPNCPSTGAPGKARRASAPAPPSAPQTTLMIKNIPNQLRRDCMLEFLDGYCQKHSVAYDFFYLPMDFKKPDYANLGYAFVNFTTAPAALKMKEELKNYKWKGRRHNGKILFSKKICEIEWAMLQGKEANMRRYEKSRFNCSNDEFLPVAFDPPHNGSDPNPPPPRIVGNLSSRAD